MGNRFLVTILMLKCIYLVFYGENGQNEYILIIFSFTNIVSIVAKPLIYDDFNL